MAPKDNDANRQLSAEDTLQKLAFIAMEDANQKSDLFLVQNRKNKEKKKNKPKTKENGGNDKQSAAEDKAAEKRDKERTEASGKDARAKMKPEYDPALELGPEFDDAPVREEPSSEPETPPHPVQADDPFADFEAKINEEGRALKEPLAESPKKKKEKKKKKSKPLSFAKEVGEEVTKEHAEKVISGEKTNKELGGRRATIIVHRVVVDKDGEPVDEEAVAGAKHPEEVTSESSEIPAPEELREEEPAPGPEKKPSCLMLVRKDTGEAFTLDRSLTIGREEDNDIVIGEPEGHYVSGHHALISLKGKDVYLKDIGSTNGTFVGNQKIGSKRLFPGQEVKFADIEFTVEEG